MKRIYCAVFLVSCSALIFEVSLTRLFSIHLWYHFAFMVISIAMLGTGSAGTLLYMINSSKTTERSRSISDHQIAFCTALAGISFLLSYITSNYIPFDPARISWEAFQFIYLFLYCLTLSIPFFFSGIMIASVFAKYSRESSSVYGSDLFGAGSGSILIIVVLNISGPEYAVILTSTICLTAAILIGGRHIKYLCGTFIFINLLLLTFHPAIIDVKISDYKNLSLALTYPGSAHIKTYHSSYARIDTFTSPLVRFAPGLSLNYLGPLPEQTGIAIDGGRSEVVTYAGNESAMNFIDFLPSSMSYDLVPKERVLVIDPKGGLQLMTAKRYGFQTIHGVESNPLLADVIKKDYNAYSGGIYNQNIGIGLGRNFLDQLSDAGPGRLYDLIDIPVEDTSVGGLFGISENYKYTTEAIEKYLNGLTSNGILSINLYLNPPPRTELRILLTIMNVLKKAGVKEPQYRLAAIRSWDTVTILVKNTDFTGIEIERIKKFAHSRRFDLVYYPGIKAEEANIFIKMQSNSYWEQFNTIINQNNTSSYAQQYLFDITPVHDDNPFFHYFLKLRNIHSIYKIMGEKVLFFIEQGYLLPVILVIIILLSIILIIAPVLFSRHSPMIISRHFVLSLWYFSMIGLGFMFIETTLIQKSILLIENPSLSVSTVLATLLISSGAGSFFSSSHPGMLIRSSTFILCILLGLFIIMQSSLFSYFSAWSLHARIAGLIGIIFPIGFFMGIPFPMGIKLIGQINNSLIPWVWAVNACFSVIAPVIAVMLAISSGFHSVILFAIISYLIAYAALIKLSSV